MEDELMIEDSMNMLYDDYIVEGTKVFDRDEQYVIDSNNERWTMDEWKHATALALLDDIFKWFHTTLRVTKKSIMKQAEELKEVDKD